MMKKVIDSGRESNGLCIMELAIQEPHSIACFASTFPFQFHCCPGHSPLKILKKLCPNLGSSFVLDCQSYQFAKHHGGNYPPRVNKRLLVHLDILGTLCC